MVVQVALKFLFLIIKQLASYNLTGAGVSQNAWSLYGVLEGSE